MSKVFLLDPVVNSQVLKSWEICAAQALIALNIKDSFDWYILPYFFIPF